MNISYNLILINPCGITIHPAKRQFDSFSTLPCGEIRRFSVAEGDIKSIFRAGFKGWNPFHKKMELSSS